MRTIVIADAVMGLDNVLAVAGAAHGSVLLVVLGLAHQHPDRGLGLDADPALDRALPGVLYLGGAVLAWTAAKMIVAEPLFADFARRPARAVPLVYRRGIIGGVLGLAWLRNRDGTEAGRRSAMKMLVPVDGSTAALAPIAYLECAGARRASSSRCCVLNVQPRFHRTSRASPAARRARRFAPSAAPPPWRERSRPCRGAASRSAPSAELGMPAERIAAVAERERVDEIMIGVGRHPPGCAGWPSIAQGVMARTDIPVTVFARGRRACSSATPCPRASPDSPRCCSPVE